MAKQEARRQGRPEWRHYDLTTDGRVDDYLYSILPKRDAVLVEMEDYASQHDIPIVGPAVARILEQLALMISAKTVFELGSAIGYSTIWWAKAVGENGRVIYTDGDKKNAERARGYFDQARRDQPCHAPYRRRSGSSIRTEAAIRYHFQRCGQRGLPAGAAADSLLPASGRFVHH